MNFLAAIQLPFAPEQASEHAPQVDLLFWSLVGVSCGLLALVFGPMLWWIYHYRAGSPADRTPLKVATWKIEVAWTTVTTGIFLAIYVWGAVLYVDLKRPPAEALEINVIGRQWMWKVQHAEGRREVNALHVPIGRTVKLVMTSQDVIHDFSIPAFRIKQDVVPGRYTTEWFKATQTGVYHLFCTEYCGAEHSKMVGDIVVQTPADYQAWLSNGAESAEPMVAAGARLYTQLGCSGCHGENSKVRAPSLVGLWGKPVPLETGQIVMADDIYIHDSILQPMKQVVAGYAPVMPTYQGQLSEEEVFQLVTYLKSLHNDTPPEYLRQSENVAGQPVGASRQPPGVTSPEPGTSPAAPR